MDFKKSFFSLSRISNKEIQSENESNSISSNSNDNNLFVNNFNNEKKYEKHITGHVLLTTDNYKFIITLSSDTIGDKHFTIYSGEQECVGIMKENSENIIYLCHLNFFQTCAKNKSLIKKNGTLEMLFCALQYVRDYYSIACGLASQEYNESNKVICDSHHPHLVEDFKYIFQDDSSIKINNTNLSLRIIYILLYGQTWYMKYVNAVPDDIIYSQSLIILNNYLDSNKDNIIYFFKFTINQNNTQNNNSKIDNLISNQIFELFKKKNSELTKIKLLNQIKKIYKNSNNSRKFLIDLYKKYGMIIFLVINYFGYYQKILEKLKIKLYVETNMIIPISLIKNIDIIRNIEYLQ